MSDTRNCRHCHAPFSSNVPIQVFCSAECRIKSTWRVGNAPKRDPKPCRCCQTPFIPQAPNSQFCGTCAEVQKLEKLERRRIVCPICKGKFLRTAPTQIYCSKECRVENQRVQPRECRTCGEPFQPVASQQYCRGCRKTKRRPKRYSAHKGERCTRCGFEPQHPCQLDVHHVDGDCENDDPANLETVCANCHRLEGLGIRA